MKKQEVKRKVSGQRGNDLASLCSVVIRQEQKQSENQKKLCPQNNSNLSKSHWKYFHFIFLPPLGLLCALCDRGYSGSY